MKQPIVSVIVPTFNYGAYIGETLSTIHEQSYRDWECIVLDDGSTDNTAEIVSQFIKKDHRIRYQRQVNQGLSSARNGGLHLASGRFIQLLDSDDLLSPNKIERQVTFMETHPEIGISYTDAFYFRHGNSDEKFRKFEYINEKEFELNNNRWIPQEDWNNPCDLIEHLYMQNIAPVNSMLIRKEVFETVGAFDESFTSLEDWHFFSRAALNGIRFTYFDDQEAYAKIRIHTDSMSFNGERMAWHHMKVLLEMERGIRRSKLPCSPPTKMIERFARKFIRRTGLGNLSSLRSLANEMGLPRTVKLYLKELNAARRKRSIH